MHRISSVVCIAMTASAMLHPSASHAEPIARDGKYYLFVGTSTVQGATPEKGVYAYRFDSITGKAEPIGLVGEAPNPSAVAVHPTQDYLYTANNAVPGSVTAFKINRETGKLTQMNQPPASGARLCSVEVDATGKMLMAAHCQDGTLATFPVRNDGSLGAATVTGRSSGKDPYQSPRVQSAIFSIDNRFLFATDFGSDKVMSYKVDAATARLTPNHPPFASVKAGSGPIRFVFHPSGKFAYALNSTTSAVTVFRYDAAAGRLNEAQTVGAKPETFAGNNTGSEIQVHPSGMFVYAANLGDDSLAVFRVDETNGKLMPLGHTKTGGKTPHTFRASPEGKWLIAANHGSNTMAIFRVDVNTGLLTATGDTLPAEHPVSLKFVPVTNVPAGGRGGRGGRGTGAGTAPTAPGRGGR
jgi:6-phosphogluconolactonase